MQGEETVSFCKVPEIGATQNPIHLQTGKGGTKRLNKATRDVTGGEGQRQEGNPGPWSSLFPSEPPCHLLLCTAAAERGSAPRTEVWSQWVLSYCQGILHLRRMLAFIWSIILFSGTDEGGKAQRSQAKPFWEPTAC